MLVHSPKITRQVDDLFLSFPLKGRDELREAQKLVAQHRTEDKPLELTLKKARKSRSVNANAYMWVLCQALAEVLGTTKEAVYRTFVRDCQLQNRRSTRRDAVMEKQRCRMAHRLRKQP